MLRINLVYLITNLTTLYLIYLIKMSKKKIMYGKTCKINFFKKMATLDLKYNFKQKILTTLYSL